MYNYIFRLHGDCALQLFTEPAPIHLRPTSLPLLELSLNISWSPILPTFGTSDGQSDSVYDLRIKSASILLLSFQLNETYYIFTAPENTPPCEVYNFSVTATPVGATYTGDGCSVPSPVLSRMLPSLPGIERLESSLEYFLSKINSTDGIVQLEVDFLVSSSLC